MRVCAVDLGAMSFHLLCAEVSSAQELRMLSDMKRATRLGAKTIQERFIDSQSWRLSMQALDDIAQEIYRFRPERTAIVATSALRAARNSSEFIREVAKRHSLDVTVLSGEEEARLSYWGATSALTPNESKLAVVDLGGGSLEIAFGVDNSYLRSTTISSGLLSLRDSLNIQSPMDPLIEEGLRDILSAALAPTQIIAERVGPQRVFFASGATRAVHSLARKLFGNRIEDYSLSLAELQALRTRTATWCPTDFAIYGVPEHRLDVMGIAMLTIELILKSLRLQTANFSQRGLREGVALHAYCRQSAGPQNFRVF